VKRSPPCTTVPSPIRVRIGGVRRRWNSIGEVS
jgi:hypothetical protein